MLSVELGLFVMVPFYVLIYFDNVQFIAIDAKVISDTIKKLMEIMKQILLQLDGEAPYTKRAF
jgi:hypothetical protein